ncbi:NifB/NifX family molybdenum-iron cluster-binding protein [bacterium]|nr:NifB/NifX family molybdenum-iron cluster-binding protein [bacterium]
MICITSQGKTRDSLIDPRFGRASFFIFLDEEGKIKKVVENSGVNLVRGAGIAAAQTVVDENAKAVITGNIGPNALFALNQSGVEVFVVPSIVTVEQGFLMWKNKELSPVTGASVSGWGRGRGRGRGRGMGFGRGFGRRI